jgi:hypothetical protein
MGGGGTIAEGIRRLFQRGRSSNTSSTSSSKHNNNNNNNNNDDRVLVKDLRSQLANIPTSTSTTHHHQSLSNIKVPIYAPFPSSSSSMDPNKKVCSSSSSYHYYCSLCVLLDSICFFLFSPPSLTHMP